MYDSFGTGFFRFACGFVGMLSLGFVVLIVVGVYQVEFLGDRNISATNIGIIR